MPRGAPRSGRSPTRSRDTPCSHKPLSTRPTHGAGCRSRRRASIRASCPIATLGAAGHRGGAVIRFVISLFRSAVRPRPRRSRSRGGGARRTTRTETSSSSPPAARAAAAQARGTATPTARPARGANAASATPVEISATTGPTGQPSQGTRAWAGHRYASQTTIPTGTSSVRRRVRRTAAEVGTADSRFAARSRSPTTTAAATAAAATPNRPIGQRPVCRGERRHDPQEDGHRSQRLPRGRPGGRDEPGCHDRCSRLASRR